MKGLEIKDLPFALRAIVASDHVMGESKQDILLKSADAIEELVAAVPKWHPVSDPPKEPGRYICVVESQIWKGGYYAEVLTFSHGLFHDVGIRDDVVYWMRLPESPKEATNDPKP